MILYLLLSVLFSFTDATADERTLELINYKPPLPIKLLERVMKNKLDGIEDLAIASARESYDPFIRFKYLTHPFALQHYFLNLKVSAGSKWYHFNGCKLSFKSEPDNNGVVALFHGCPSQDNEIEIDFFELYKNELNLIATKERKASLKSLRLKYYKRPIPAKELERTIKSKLGEFEDLVIVSVREIHSDDNHLIDLKVSLDSKWYHFTNCELYFFSSPSHKGNIAYFDDCISDDGNIPIDSFSIHENELKRDPITTPVIGTSNN